MRDWVRSGLLAGWLVAAVLAGTGAKAQGTTVSVQDVVTDAGGAGAQGNVVVSWGAFTTAGGSPVAAGSLTKTLGSGGTLNVALLPNAGATPFGSYYTAVFHLSDGSTSREFWVVPFTVSGTVKLAAIRNQVLPLSVAMQTVSKQYVDTAVAKAIAGVPPNGNVPFVLKTGDAVTGPLSVSGPLTLGSDPVLPMQAADKRYVDAAVSGITAGSGSSGVAGGDLSGSFPNPTVTAVHANAGTLDGVPVGATTASTGRFTSLSLDASGTPVMVTPGVGGGQETMTVTGASGSDKVLLRVLGSYYSGLAFGTPGDMALMLYASDGIGFYVNGTELQKATTGGYRMNTSLDVRNTSANAFCATGVLLCVNETLFTVDTSGHASAQSFHEALTTPASSSASCSAGDFTDDANFHYVCVAANQWKRIALGSF